jgi:hypothetical protein
VGDVDEFRVRGAQRPGRRWWIGIASTTRDRDGDHAGEERASDEEVHS